MLRKGKEKKENKWERRESENSYFLLKFSSFIKFQTRKEMNINLGKENHFLLFGLRENPKIKIKQRIKHS